MWSFDLNYRCLELGVETADTGTYTTTRLCELLRSARCVREVVQYLDIKWTDDDFDCSDSDLEAVGNALHDLQRFDELRLVGCWPDAKASVLLRRLPKTKIRFLYIASRRVSLRISSVITELQRGVGLTFLTRFWLERVVLDEHDCGTLGQLLRSRQGKFLQMNFEFCTFPSLTGYLVVADALIESGRFDVCGFGDNTILNATIPSYDVSSITKPHGDFYKHYEREKDEDDEERFTKAARNHLRQYSDLNDAGRSTVLSTNNRTSEKHWVDALCHDKVRNSVDYLYHFVSMNPNIYVTAARLGMAKEGLAFERESFAGRVLSRRRLTSSNDDDNVGFESDIGSIAGRVKRRRRQEHPKKRILHSFMKFGNF